MQRVLVCLIPRSSIDERLKLIWNHSSVSFICKSLKKYFYYILFANNMITANKSVKLKVMILLYTEHRQNIHIHIYQSIYIHIIHTLLLVIHTNIIPNFINYQRKIILL